ncbi:hypothetical protein [Shewanella sp. YIC-542]|uniref:hypothetical protein n=1 Tax=Shewanella mytili TaxID=3377111 RepID=UPI00398F8811
MLVRVTDVSFTTNQPWLFKFADSENKEYLVLNSETYAKYGLPNPVNRTHLDQLDVGMPSKIAFKVIDGKNIVTSIR